MDEYQKEQEWGDELYGDFLAEELDDMFYVPLHTGFVQNKTADEEEHRHADENEVIMYRNFQAFDLPTVGCNVLENHQYHCKTSQRIDVFYAAL